MDIGLAYTRDSLYASIYGNLFSLLSKLTDHQVFDNSKLQITDWLL